MRRALIPFLLLAPALFSSSTARASVANVLQNAGFEAALGGSNNWDNTANRGISRVTTGTPAEGAAFLRLDEADLLAGTEGAFTFQTVEEAQTGDFVTFSGLVRVNSIDAGDEAQFRIEFQNENGGLLDGTNIASQASVTAGFVRITTSGFAPQGTGDVTFTIRIQPAAVGGTTQADFDAIEGTINRTPISLQPGSTNFTVEPGSLNALVLQVHNRSADNLQGVEIVAEPQPGLVIHRTEARLDGNVVPQQEGSVIFSLGTLLRGQESTLVFFLSLASGVLPGKSYELELRARSTTGPASNVVRILVQAQLDPVFDQGTVIGKVFHDTDRDGTQNQGERGIPGVKIYTEEGLSVVTDPDGKYHFPGVKPGRHILKVDAHTLPEGTEFVTEESLLIKTTNGVMSKGNFAVVPPPSAIPREFKKELNVTISQGVDTSPPALDVRIDPEVIRSGFDVLEKEPVFRFNLNYAVFVKTWYLEIRDELGLEVWTGFGVGEPPAEVVWSGHNESGVLVKPGLYSYQWKVHDRQGHADWSLLRFFRVVSKTDPSWTGTRQMEIPPVGDFHLFRDGKQSIPLVAKPTLRVQGVTRPEYQVTVNGYPVDVDSGTGHFASEMYVSPGQKDIEVVATSPEGESTRYRETVQVKDSVFFMAALGEEQLGVNFQDGNVKTIAADDRFKAGFYEDGRLSFFLKGKLKGKFLVKAHYDTDEKRTALFTNLDPDDYYPVYGDASTRDYEAQDTLDRLYFVVEMDRSFAKWGSFKTGFTDTEMATYNRTLNGLKVHYETLASTAYGDPKRGFTLFSSQASHRGDHNEFLATGGSLYYLRNRRVIEGSEKIRVEVRDKIQEIPVASYDLMEGTDFEIDYDEGRILLSEPLSSVAASDTLISQDILDGSPVYLVVDYEYDAGASAGPHPNRGIRGYTHIGSHLRLGATAVEERRLSEDYDLRGVDAVLRFGRNTRISAEYAVTQKQQVDFAVSYNGGLSFADLDPLFGVRNQRDRENAYLIRAESKPFKRLEVSGFLQAIEPGFSTDRSRTLEGEKNYGLAARYRVSDSFWARYRFDSKEAADQLMPFEETDIAGDFVRDRVHTTQLQYDDGTRLGELEYRRQLTKLPPRRENLIPTLLSEIPFENGLAAKAGYRLNDRLMPYLRTQISIGGGPNHQFGGGLRYELAKNNFAYMEQMIGPAGDSILFGFERQLEGGGRSYVNLRSVDRGIGSKVLSTTVGSTMKVSEKSRLYSERRHSSYEGVDGFAEIVGYEADITNRWRAGARFERAHLDNSLTRRLDTEAGSSLIRTNTFNTASGVLRYEGERLTLRSYLEGRRGQDEPRMWQWVTRHSADYKVNQDLSFLGKLDFGKSRFTEPEGTPADFLELNTGLAYRPVENDRLNILSRYTYVRDEGSDLQFASALFAGVEIDERTHILALDFAYELNRYMGWVEKVAYKYSMLDTSLTDDVILHNVLLASRLNFHVTRKWDVVTEYRTLWQSDAAKTFKHGVLLEVDREFYDYVRLGIGYNFTDFDDDLRSTSNFDSHGPFVRLTGKV